MLTVDDMRTVEARTDLAFDRGVMVGKVVKGCVKKGFRWTTVLIASSIMGILFFVAGFISSRKNHK